MSTTNPVDPRPTTSRHPEVGTEGAPWTFGPITRTAIVRYAAASGDFNPIHHDEPFAIAAGFPTVFSIGMYQAGLLATYVTDWLGAEHLRRFKVRFSEQVWPDDLLTCTGVVESVDPADDGSARVHVSLSCVRQTGGVAIIGSAEFELP